MNANRSNGGASQLDKNKMASSTPPSHVPPKNSASFASTINLNEDPDKLFRLLESIGTGSYGDVYKVK